MKTRSTIPGFVLVPVSVRNSKIDGKGLFAKAAVPPRSKIGELAGDHITQIVARKRARGMRRIAIVEFEDGTALDATDSGNELKYVNHSCSPNAFIRIFRYHVEFYALRLIRPNEEITCDFGDTHHDGNIRCRCNTKQCRGYL